MLSESIALFLAVSVLFYCLFAGADFGAGMLEAFVGRRRSDEQREVINKAMGPVWEANHVWIILAIVILFVGFPKVYTTVSIAFHIPLTLMLIGVILRGCAFTFRHYDALKDKSQKWYSAIFVFSSYLTSLMLGVVAGAMHLGRVSLDSLDFKAVYISPWLNLFSFSVGLFTCTLFSFLASVYLIGESTDREIRSIFVRRAFVSNIAALVVGVFVFVAASLDGFDLLSQFMSHEMSMGSMVLATIVLIPLWWYIRKNQFQLARVFAATQVGFVLLGWFALKAPTLLNTIAGPLTIYNTAASEITLSFLLKALVVGSLVIFPAMFYLLKIFKMGR